MMIPICPSNALAPEPAVNLVDPFGNTHIITRMCIVPYIFLTTRYDMEVTAQSEAGHCRQKKDGDDDYFGKVRRGNEVVGNEGEVEKRT